MSRSTHQDPLADADGVGMTISPSACPAPCRECPWRRSAAPGWLGPYDAETWVALAHSDKLIACHLTVDGSESINAPGVRQCAGAAQYRKNVAKSPRTAGAAIAAERDTASVFGSRREFMAHHGGDR